MTEQVFLRPAAGVIVRHPDGRRLGEQGEAVTKTTYWTRRIAAGDVVQGAAPAADANPAGNGRSKNNRE